MKVNYIRVEYYTQHPRLKLYMTVIPVYEKDGVEMTIMGRGWSGLVN